MSFVSDYLKAIPGGLDAYPDYLAKASAYRTFIEGLPEERLLAALPEPLKPLITDPEPVTAWIPEVHSNVVFLTATDAILGSEAAFYAHYEQMNQRLLSGPLYRVLMMVASPSIVVRGAASRWASFHRGVTLKAESQGSNAADVVLAWPKGLFNRVIAEGYTRAFVVALRLAGAKDTTMEVTRFSDTGAEYRGTWR